jgi:hypothetical protein
VFHTGGGGGRAEALENGNKLESSAAILLHPRPGFGPGVSVRLDAEHAPGQGTGRVSCMIMNGTRGPGEPKGSM